MRAEGRNCPVCARGGCGCGCGVVRGDGTWGGGSAVVGSPESGRGCEWVGCAGVAAGWRGAGAREAGDQRSSACRGRRGGASGVCGCDCRVARSGGAQGGGSAVISSPRSEKETEGGAVGEGVVRYRAYGVRRHLPASQGRGCPGEPGSVTPRRSPPIRVCIPSFGLLRPLVSLLPRQGGGVRVSGAV